MKVYMSEGESMKKEFSPESVEILPENIGDMPAFDAAPLLERAASRTEVLGWVGEFADGLRKNLRGAAAWVKAVGPEVSKKTLSAVATAAFVAASFSACANGPSTQRVFTETAPRVTEVSPTQAPPTETATATQIPISTETATIIPTETEHLTDPKILLLGDSMFAATYVPTDLSTLFKDGGIDVNFVGDKMDAGGHIPIDGFSGFDTAKVLRQLQSTSWEAGGVTYPNTISEHVPDIVVIQLGTNDLGIFKDPVAEYTSDMSNIIQFLRSKNPRVEIIISTLIPSRNAPSDEKIKLINEAIPGLVQSMNLPDSPVVATQDLRSEWKPGDFFDDFHPNTSGSEKMAKNDFDTFVNNGFVALKTQANH
jgi:lysophospholipase L1-like esterase